MSDTIRSRSILPNVNARHATIPTSEKGKTKQVEAEVENEPESDSDMEDDSKVRTSLSFLNANHERLKKTVNDTSRTMLF